MLMLENSYQVAKLNSSLNLLELYLSILIHSNSVRNELTMTIDTRDVTIQLFWIHDSI